MDDFIQFMQKTLEKIKDAEVSSTYPDEFVKGKTTITFSCSRNSLSKQTGNAFIWRYNIVIDIWADSLKKVDIASNNITGLLRNLNFDIDTKDMGKEENKRRFQIQGTSIYNELNKKLYNQGGY